MSWSVRIGSYPAGGDTDVLSPEGTRQIFAMETTATPPVK